MTRIQMTKITRWLALMAWCVAQSSLAAPSRPEFHRLTYALHEKQVAQSTVRTTVETGKYNGMAAEGYTYQITSYFDAKTGKLLSKVQRDAALPEAIHITEVNIYDNQGRIVRDYVSIAPPWKPAYPSHAYLNWHHYSNALHSFRQFELDGQVNYEFCEGELNGKPVRISLPWDDMNKATTSTTEYQACFGGMSPDWKPYLTPQ